MPGIVEPEEFILKGKAPPEIPTDESSGIHLFQHDVEIEIDFARQQVHGRSILTLCFSDDDVAEVHIDARQFEIDVSQITVSNCKAEASYSDPCDLIKPPKNYLLSASHWPIMKHRIQPLQLHPRKEVSALDHDLKGSTCLIGSIRIKLPSKDEIVQKNKNLPRSVQSTLGVIDGKVSAYVFSIPFKSKKTSDGYHFVGCNERDIRYPHVYTRHSYGPGTASAIFPCIEDPNSRTSYKLSITCPRTLGDAFRRPPATQHPKGLGDFNASRKRKRNEETSQEYENDGGWIELTEEDMMLDLTVVCAGILTGEVIHKDDNTKKTMTFEMDRHKSLKHVGFAVGPFEHVDLWSEFRREEDDTKLTDNALKVHGYCLPGRAAEVRNTCSTLVPALDYLVLSFGRFPSDSFKICFVDDMIQESVPLVGAALCSSRLLYPPSIREPEVEVARKIAHMLSCQWFGVNIIPNTKADIWLVAGCAWYLADHFMRYLCGNNYFRFQMKSMADRLVELDIRRPCLQDIGEHLDLGDFEADFMNLKAPLVLFILDRRISKSANNMGVYKIIGRMVTKANTSPTSSDEILMVDAFKRACEKAGNQRLDPFWNQWILSSGCPRFDVNQRFNKKRLCVEMTIQQKQDAFYRSARALDKDDFWRNIVEEKHGVDAAEPQQSFTGPMTIRIHEADGTPYEHIVEIREDAAKSVKFEIPYNTKYKRLKRNRRQRERALASSSKANDDAPKDLYYLGDVMQQADEMEAWDFRDWDEETEAKMDQESYEWIRMDADFEWICEMQTNMPAYMYASQLQQDRDVVAQQDSMCYLHRVFSTVGPHPLMSTILARTVLDARYYYGIRMMAIEELPRHISKDGANWGLKHLLKAYQHFFCYPGTSDPLRNDFSDKRQYLVQCAMLDAIARIRGEDGKCPKEVRRFLLRQLQYNDNSRNIFSDQPYICTLIKALAICQIPDDRAKQKKSIPFGPVDADEDEAMAIEPVDTEPEEFRDLVLEEIDRFRRMDEHSPSYENCFTLAALDAYCRLMKAEVIKRNPARFIEYLQDRTYDLVRIKACESLVELGMLTNKHFIRMFLLLASTDPSPFVRDRIFKALCRGLASMAIGEDEQEDKKAEAQPAEDGLIVEQDEAVMEANKHAKARKEDLSVALAALKAKTTDDEGLQEAVWKALTSPVLNSREQIRFIDLCSVLFEEDQSLIMCFPYPSYWRAERGEKIRSKCFVKFKRHYRTKPRKLRTISKPPPKPEPKRTITLNLNRSASISAKASTPTAEAQPPPPPATSTSKSSDVVSIPKVTIPSLKHLPSSKEKIPAPPTKGSSAQEPPPKKLKQSINVPVSRSATPSASQEKSKEKPKMGESHRDSISVQAPLRPTIELQQQEPKTSVPKINGSTHPAPLKVPKPSKPLKRASTESEGPRPTKIVKLNTSKIPRTELEKLQKRPKARKPRKLVTVKFAAWDRLRVRKSKTPQAGSIRATPKHRRLDDKPIGKSPRPFVGPASPMPRIPESTQIGAPSTTVTSSQNSISTPNSSFKTESQSGATSEKKRKPLPEMRKPLPSAAPTNTPTTSSKQLSSIPTTAPKGPTKLKIKLKAPTSGSN